MGKKVITVFFVMATLPWAYSEAKVGGKANRYLINASIDQLELTCSADIDFTGVVYSYLKSKTTLKSLIPQWDPDDGNNAFLNRIRNAGTREVIPKETTRGIDKVIA